MTQDEARAAIADAVQTAAPLAEETGRSAVLTGWALIAEWMDEDGDRWLSRLAADGMTSWQEEGLYHHALYGDWPDPDEEPT